MLYCLHCPTLNKVFLLLLLLFFCIFDIIWLQAALGLHIKNIQIMI